MKDSIPSHLMSYFRPKEVILPKNDLVIPHRFAIAMQQAGWILRQDLIFAKPAPMPESVTDRCTRSHEHIFMFSKQQRYYYDATAIAEPFADNRAGASGARSLPYSNGSGRNDTLGNGTQQGLGVSPLTEHRNRRSVWVIGPQPFLGEHYAGFPVRLPELCLLAGSAPRACPHCRSPWRRVVEKESRPNAASLTGKYNGDGVHRTISCGVWNDRRHREEKGWTPGCSCPANDGSGRCIVLDPFAGSGTTLVAAIRHGREAWGIELNQAYIALAERRIMVEIHKDDVLDRRPITIAEGQQSLFPMGEEAPPPVKDKQGASGLRTYAGFNQRWAAKEREEAP